MIPGNQALACPIGKALYRRINTLKVCLSVKPSLTCELGTGDCRSQNISPERRPISEDLDIFKTTVHDDGIAAGQPLDRQFTLNAVRRKIGRHK